MKNFMKKIATLTFTFLTFALILIVLTACAGQDGGAAGPVDAQAIEDNEDLADNGVEEDIDVEAGATLTDVYDDIEYDDVVANGEFSEAFAMYLAAEQAIEDAGSVLVTSVTNMVMHIEEEGESLVINSTARSTLEMVYHDTDNIDMRMEMVTEMDLPEGPMEIPMTTYFRDGTMYIYVDGEGMKMDLPMEEVMEMADSGLLDFDESAILMQDVNDVGGGTELSFTLDANAMTDLIEGMLAEMGLQEFGVAMQGDILFTVFLDENGDIQTVDMSMDLIFEEEGEVLFTMEMHQSSVFQVGGVTVDFPDYIDDFEYVEL